MNKISLALGSGAMRGFAHIGAIEVLENNFKIEAMSGCSIGAVIGSFYALGYDLSLIYKVAKQIRKDILIDFRFKKESLISGKNIEEILKLFLRDKKFSDTKLPFYIVSTNLKTGEQIVFSEGLLFDAVRSSISIPGVLPPYKLDDYLLVDGAVVDKVPAKILKDKGFKNIIGIDVSNKKSYKTPRNLIEVIMTTIDIMSEEIFLYKKQFIDYLIDIPLDDINPYTLDDVEKCYIRGKETAINHLDNLINFLNR